MPEEDKRNQSDYNISTSLMALPSLSKTIHSIYGTFMQIRKMLLPLDMTPGKPSE
jgi:hypothetical protein